jgi:hypothetical protein
MRQYETKTGFKLTCIQGDGQGDGIPRGILKLVTQDHIEPKVKASETELDPRLDGSTVCIQNVKGRPTLVVLLNAHPQEIVTGAFNQEFQVRLGTFIGQNFHLQIDPHEIGRTTILKTRRESDTHTARLMRSLDLETCKRIHGYKGLKGELIMLKRGHETFNQLAR